jgi:hypothetical protein
VQAEDAFGGCATLWSRADRTSRLVAEISTDPFFKFKRVRPVRGPIVRAISDFTGAVIRHDQLRPSSVDDSADVMPKTSRLRKSIVGGDVIAADEPRGIPGGLPEPLQLVEVRVRHRGSVREGDQRRRRELRNVDHQLALRSARTTAGRRGRARVAVELVSWVTSEPTAVCLARRATLAASLGTEAIYCRQVGPLVIVRLQNAQIEEQAVVPVLPLQRGGDQVSIAGLGKDILVRDPGDLSRQGPVEQRATFLT